MPDDSTPPTQADLDARRLRSCVEAWPDAISGGYHPRCCRFPKSCSPHGYIEAIAAGNLTFADLEDAPACPDDPDGLHHSGCGCDDVDPISPNERTSP